jgi:predicted SnoaL-like aldol condensation-catalyzing enzyme
MNLARHIRLGLAAVGALTLVACAGPQPAAPTQKQQVVDLLKSFETGDSKARDVISPTQYIQHNLGVGDGRAALEARLQGRLIGSTKVNTVRVFQDGAFVFAHTAYNFSGNARVGFDIFRFDSGKIVEHWDNLQEPAATPSPSGHTMLDGPLIASDLDKTAVNKALMQRYMDDLLQGRKETFTSYFDNGNYLQHSPLVADNLTGLFAGLQALAKEGKAVKYDKVHQVLAEGNFVLVVAEGSFGGKPASYYDFYRIQNGKIAEHWDTIEFIPPRDAWKNANGKF